MDPVTRTLYGLLATGRTHKEKPDMQNEQLRALGASGRWIVLTLATLEKLVSGAGRDPVHSIWSLVIVLSQHCGQ